LRDVGPGMFIFSDSDVFLATCDKNRRDFFSQPTLRLRAGSTLLTAPGVGVLTVAQNPALPSKVVRSLGHGIDAISRLHSWVNEMPSESAVLELLRSAKGGVSLGHNERRSRHA